MSLNRQLVLNDAFAALMKQGQPAKCAMDIACYYRHPTDPALRCGIGHLIRDEDYNSVIEGQGVGSLLDSERLKLDPKYGTAKITDIHFLAMIQLLHDSRPPSEWHSGFAHLAADFNLEKPKWPSTAN